jgi:WD40 repeat protein/tRNA A-37 threonylcarbamoyl transferase component Bud32
MSDTTNIPDDSVTRARLIDEICDAFEAAWKAGGRPILEEFLEQGGEADRQKLLQELVPIDVTYRLIRGEQPGVADYVLRFGGLDAAWVEQLIGEHSQPKQGSGSNDPTVGLRPSVAGTRPVIRYFGDYELLAEVARGGMGVVYKARQVKLNRVVAVKMILSGQLASPADVERFHTEAEAAAQLDHPGIVPIYEVGQHEGLHFFSMGFIEGQSLSARLVEGPLPVREAVTLVRAVAEAVQYAHDKGVIHRDLKPSNILVGTDGKPRVTDFGLAKLTESGADLTGTGQVLGTPSFMPPEQAAAQVSAVGRASDIYSLGAVLYCLLTGRPPFQAATALETLLQVQKQEPLAPRQLNPAIPLDLDTIILKCLDKSPSRRYRTANDLADELTRYLENRPILARRVSRTERFWRWCCREPIVSSLCAAVLLAMLIGTAVSAYFAVKERQRAEVEALERQRADTEAARANSEAERANTKAQEAADNARTALENAERERQQRERAQVQTRLAQRHLYAAHMNLAQAAWEDARVGAVWSLLEQHKPKAGEDDLRGFEWHYWDRMSHSGFRTLHGHTQFAVSVAFSPDGQRLASAGYDQTVNVWDRNAADWRKSLTLNGHAANVWRVTFSPDGKRLASASKDLTVKVWDAATGLELLTLKGHTAEILSVAFSPDGQRLSSGSSDNTVKVWDAATGEELLTLKGHTATVYGVAFSPDGQRLATASLDQTVKVWDAVTGQESFALKGHIGYVYSVTFSPDGKRLASAGNDHTIKLWEAATGEEILTLRGHANGVWSVAFSPDGQRLATACADRTVKLWDSATGRELLTLKGHTDSVLSVAFSPDGKLLASAGLDTTIKVWDATTNQGPRKLIHSGPVFGVALSPDGKRLVSASGQYLESRKPGEIKVLDAATGRESLSLKLPISQVSSVAFSPDGQRLALATEDQKAVKVWDAANGQESLTLEGHTNSVTGVAFSPDGQRLASASHDQTVKLWDAITGQELLTLMGHKAEVRRVAFSPDGQRLASASWDQTVKVWRVATGQELFMLKGHSGAVQSVAFSPDGQRLASAGNDLTIKLWDTATGQELLTLKGHTRAVTSAAFSPDGKRLASASLDNTVKVWDPATGQELLTLKGHTGNVWSVAFRPDGNRLVSASYDGTVKVWDATPRNEVDQQPAASAALSEE